MSRQPIGRSLANVEKMQDPQETQHIFIFFALRSVSLSSIEMSGQFELAIRSRPIDPGLCSEGMSPPRKGQTSHHPAANVGAVIESVYRNSKKK